MTKIRLSKYVDDDGRLSEAGDAEFIRKKLKPEDTFDFTGVTAVTGAFLEELFKDRAPESLLDAISGAEEEVEKALEAWLDHQPAAKTPARKRPEPQPIKAPEPRLSFAQQRNEGERYTPTRLANRLREQLTRYIESAYPLNEPILLKSRRAILQHADNGRLLAQDPFVETTSRYKAFAGGYSALTLDEQTKKFLSEIASTPKDYEPNHTLLYPGLYTHQAEALQAFLGRGKNLVVATGTGSGKTECFLIPLLGSLYREASQRPANFQVKAVRSLILYPMNALVNDQLSRLRLLFGSEACSQKFRSLSEKGRHPTFGMYTGRTPYAGPKERDKDEMRVGPLLKYYLKLSNEMTDRFKKLGRYPAKDLVAFLGEDKTKKTINKKGEERTQHNWDKRLMTSESDRELMTRQEMVRDASGKFGASPDILVTNYSMLEYMLMRPFERPIFDETREWLKLPESRFLLVLDEAHMYRGAKGAEVAFLIRRLLSRLDIIGKPEKLAVILSSASLGERSKAQAIAQKFAADITGQPPESFEIIFGQRETPSPASPADATLAEVLASIDLDSLHAAASAEVLRQAIEPVFGYLKQTLPTNATVEELLSATHAALQGRPFINQVLLLTAGHAVSLESLSDKLFPETKESATRRKATEVLLTLGTIARPSLEDPGLLPTRVHMMFRGVGGIYACLNPQCKGRQEAPGQKASVGKLFVESRTNCDVCGSRVFELASCRECGGAYLQAYANNEDLDKLTFLWGEGEGDLVPLWVLPSTPRNIEGTYEFQVQLSTGSILTDGRTLHEEEARTLWMASNKKTGARQVEFEQCPLCQPPGSRREARISNLRTRGEQPFTALIETQFSEQPPQKTDPSLPNQGRKVLVFSDGRQKAARLAPALETSHVSDAFRQIVSLAVRDLNEIADPGRLTSLYPAVLKVCHQKGVDLFPASDETQFHNHLVLASQKELKELLQLSNIGSLQPPTSYAKALFGELTDRFFSLSSIGLAAVQEDPVYDFYFTDFPQLGLSKEENQILIRSWLRVQLERGCFLPPGASSGVIAEGYERPEGIGLKRRQELIPTRFYEFLRKVLGATKAEQLVQWFENFLTKGMLLFTNNMYYLQPNGLTLKLRMNEPWMRCLSCNRLYAEAIQNTCIECLGSLVDASSDPLYLDARSGYYREQVRRALSGNYLEPFGLSTAEHSSQLVGLDQDDVFAKTEKYELRFQDIRVDGEPPIDILSCTTTMEVGIDIGTLSGVALRNVPPHVANYQQRAGRAGRRGRSIASVLTYAHGGSHDAYFYSQPAEIISGDVRAPVVYVENQRILERHINAFLIQVFFHETVAANPSLFQLFESLGKVRDFLSDQHPCSLKKLSSWLEQNKVRLIDNLKSWVPSYSHALGQQIQDVAQTIHGAIPALLQRLQEVLPATMFIKYQSTAGKGSLSADEQSANSTPTAENNSVKPPETALEQAEREALNRQLEENLLQTLVERAVIPRYAFPTDTVNFWVAKPRKPGDPKFKRDFDYQPQRDLQIALSEYAPGRSLTIDKFRFTSAALYSPYQPDVSKTLQRAGSYVACKVCSYVSLSVSAEAQPICPVCGSVDLFKRRFVTPEGFAPDINKPREVDRGGTVTYAGQSTPAKMEVEQIGQWSQVCYDGRLKLLTSPKKLVVVNKGKGDRGFMICSSCGYSDQVFGPGHTKVQKSHQHPTEEGTNCQGNLQGPFFLGHQFPTDVLLLRLQLQQPLRCPIADVPGRPNLAAKSALTSMVEALCLSASRVLQIDEGELAGNWNPVLDNPENEADIYLYDLLPGGAGYTHQIRANLDDVLAATEALLAGCSCESSCYRCLRHYNNQLLHASLDRHLALALVRHMTRGEVPSLSAQQREASLAPLIALLRLREVKFSKDQTEEGLVVPLVVHLKDGTDVWVDVHHPLIDPEKSGSVVVEAATSIMVPVVSLDTYTLQHNLPEAYLRTMPRR